MRTHLVELVTIVIRSLATCLERVWVELFMLVVVAVMPRRPMSLKEVLHNVYAVVALTIAFMLARGVVARILDLDQRALSFHGNTTTVRTTSEKK